MIIFDTLKCLIVLLFLIPSAALSDAFEPIKDSYTNGLKPEDTFGHLTALRVNSFGPSYSFLAFDLSSISGSPVASATLTINLSTIKKAGTIGIRTASNDWNESSITFSNQPAFSEVLTTKQIENVDSNNSISIDVTNIVQTWADGSTANHGFVLTSQKLNIKLDTRESGQSARLDIVTNNSQPIKSHVNVPGDFSTIQQAVSGIRDSWCPENATQCAIVVGAGIFDGFECCVYNNISLAVVGRGESATILGPTVIDGTDGVELRDLTVNGNLWIKDLSGSVNPIFLDDVTIVGEAGIFEDRIDVDEGSDTILSDVNAHLFYIDLSSSVIITESEIETLFCSESRINTNNSSLGFLQAFECRVNIANSSIDDISVFENILKVTNSNVSGNVKSDATVYFGNSRVSGDFIDLGDTTTKCSNVINTNFDAYKSDCSSTQ